MLDVMTRVLGALALVALAIPASAAELQPATVVAFERYVQAAEARMKRETTFIRVDGLDATTRQAATDALRREGLHIERMLDIDKGRRIHVPDALVHHWLGLAFIQGGTVDRAVSLLQDYDRHATVYAPSVARARTLARSGDSFRVFIRFFMKKGITVVVNSEHTAHFERLAPDRARSRIASTRIAEVDAPDTADEREKPVGRDGGYVWRLNSYWRFLERDGGVYVQCETITLTRGIPAGLGWLIRPFVTSIPRETLAFTMGATRRALAAER